MIGKKVIVRCSDSSVFYGTLAMRNGQETELTDARRIWYWSGAASTFQLSIDGVADPRDCKFTVVIARIALLSVLEILPCTDKAIACIESVPVWKI